MHEGTFGTHSSGHTMAKKIIRVGYYWSTMEQIVINIPELVTNARSILIKYLYL